MVRMVSGWNVPGATCTEPDMTGSTGQVRSDPIASFGAAQHGFMRNANANSPPLPASGCGSKAGVIAGNDAECALADIVPTTTAGFCALLRYGPNLMKTPSIGAIAIVGTVLSFAISWGVLRVGRLSI